MLYVVTKILPIVGFEPFGLNGVGMLCIRSFFWPKWSWNALYKKFYLSAIRFDLGFFSLLV